MSLFKRFEQACGLKLNADKSEVLKLGTDRKTYVPDSNYNMKWPQSPIKALGQLVVNDSAQMQKINEEECVSRVENSIGKLKGILKGNLEEGGIVIEWWWGTKSEGLIRSLERSKKLVKGRSGRKRMFK